MKKILVLLAIVVLSFPVVSYAEYYFVTCKEGTIFKYSVSDEVVRNFKKGELFIASSGLPFSVLAADMPDGFIGLKWGHSLDKMRDEGLFDRVIINDKNPDK